MKKIPIKNKAVATKKLPNQEFFLAFLLKELISSEKCQ